MPRPLAQLVGVRDGRLAMRLLGVREMAAGVALLAQRRPTAWLWSRVAGDLMDLGMLGLAMMDKRNDRGRIVASMAAVAGVTGIDVSTAREASDSSTDDEQASALHLVKAITVRKPVDEVYAYWRNFRNFPTFMRHVDSVGMLDERRSHWTVRGPAGRSVEWDAEIVEDQPNARIAWRSLPGSDVSHSGSVRFSPAPGNRGTEVRVQLYYNPPAGRLGATVARFFGEEPRQQVQADLRKFKQVLETGEVIRSEATIAGASLLQRAATPASAVESTGARA